MQTRSLRTLVAVAKIGSFAKTAAELNMTLSALSMQMKALEAELGAALFDRSVRPPRLTPLARSVVAEAQQMLHREDALIELCRPSHDLVGQYRVGFVTTAAVRLLPGFLRAAQARLPKACFAFETGLSQALQRKVASGQIDAAVVTTADPLPGPLLSQHVLQHDRFVFAAQGALLTDGLPGLLRTQPFFHFMPGTGIGTLIAGAMRAHAEIGPARIHLLDNLEAIMECVSHGLGFTLLPEPDVDRYRAGDVQKLPCPRPLQRTLVLTVAADGALARHLPVLAGLLKADAA